MEKKVDIEDIIKETIPNKDRYLIGFANLENLLDIRFQGYDYGIIIGRRLDDTIIDALEAGPTPAYYAHYCEVNTDLSKLVNDMASELTKNHVDSLAIPPTTTDLYRASDYPKTLRQKFSHKMVGTRAGLGWIGKTDLFISERFGPRVRLASILTSQPLPLPKKPIETSKCGDCNICVELCPAQAASGKLWNTNIDRDEFYDAFRCSDKAKELTLRLVGIDESICGICVRACPIGRK